MRPGLSHVLKRARVRAGALVVDNMFRGLAAAGRLLPIANPARYGLEVTRDLAYVSSGDHQHLVDVWRPGGDGGRLPVVLYLHGGSFRILSKDSHWMMALSFARQGYVVFNASYRLAPRHPFPAAVEDASRAYQFVLANAARFGADPARLVLAGESAGANLALTLALSATYRRREPYARAVFESGVVPRAVVPMCGLLQVSDPGRFARRRHLPSWIADRMNEVTAAYLFGHEQATPEELELADPLRVLERAEAPERPLPPMIATVGTRDPILDDTRRLDTALDRLAVPHEVHYYDGEPHAFQALVFRPNARDSWSRTFAFLDRALAKQ
jgi:acetyl esterase